MLKANTEYVDILNPFALCLYRVINHPVVRRRLKAASGVYLAEYCDGESGRWLGNAGQFPQEI